MAWHAIESQVGLAVAPAEENSLGAVYRNPKLLASLIRSALLAAGLGKKHPHAPLADLIEPGMTVLLKPNWVLDRNLSGQTMDCMVTHPAFIEVVLDEVALARPGRVILGDAPVQGCQFEQVAPAAWRQQLGRRLEAPLEVLDFRRTVAEGSPITGRVFSDLRPMDRYTLFDLGADSLLEPVSNPPGRFRVTQYDPDALAQTHRPGRHQYLLCREAFEADVILNLPKLKTHRKAGLTGALKNLVGLNGNKDYLPHHRTGGARRGGDCYPGSSTLKEFAEYCLDQANRNINLPLYHKWANRAYALLRWYRWIGNPEIEGGWYGNDTVWRMTADLNRILLYGRADGSMSDAPLRRIYSLTDAIVAGQREGPLAPQPFDLGAVTFAASSPFADLLHAALMGFNPEKISLVREAFGKFRFPLTQQEPEAIKVHADGRTLTLDEAARRYGRQAIPPHGWKRHIEASIRHTKAGRKP